MPPPTADELLPRFIATICLGLTSFVNDFSLSLLVNPADYQVVHANILDKSHTNIGWALEQDLDTDNYFGFGYSVTSSSGVGVNAQLSGSIWNYLALVKSGSTLKFYLNNILEATSISSSSSVYSNGKLPLIIGAWNFARTKPASQLRRFFKGSIDDLRIYNRALSQAEIQQNFNATRSRYGV